MSNAHKFGKRRYVHKELLHIQHKQRRSEPNKRKKSKMATKPNNTTNGEYNSNDQALNTKFQISARAPPKKSSIFFQGEHLFVFHSDRSSLDPDYNASGNPLYLPNELCMPLREMNKYLEENHVVSGYEDWIRLRSRIAYIGTCESVNPQTATRHDVTYVLEGKTSPAMDVWGAAKDQELYFVLKCYKGKKANEYVPKLVPMCATVQTVVPFELKRIGFSDPENKNLVGLPYKVGVHGGNFDGTEESRTPNRDCLCDETKKVVNKTALMSTGSSDQDATHLNKFTKIYIKLGGRYHELEC